MPKTFLQSFVRKDRRQTSFFDGLRPRQCAALFFWELIVLNAFPSNAHTHTPYCDGQTSIEDMVARAKSLGFVSLGFSGHAHQGFDPEYSMSLPNQALYFQKLRGLRVPGLRIWAGLELDGLADDACRSLARSQSDYLIGSTHYLPLPDRGRVAVDGPAELLQQSLNTFFDGDGLALTRAYYNAHTAHLLRDKPDIIGHFDLIRKHAARIGLFAEEDAAYQRIAASALEAAFPCGGVLEVNTGGIARGYLPTPYPALPLLQVWRELGGRVTLTSDCHDGRYLDTWFEQGLALIRRAGFDHVMMLGTGDQLWEEFAL